MTMLEPKEIRDRLGVSLATTYRLLDPRHKRAIPAVRVGNQIRVPEEAFEAWLAAQALGADAEASPTA